VRRAARFVAGVSLTLLVGGCSTPGPMLRDTVAPGMPASVELAGVPFHAQEDQQCGPAALATVLEFAGVGVTPAELSPLVYLPGREGSLQIELKAATRRFDRMPYELAPEPAALVAQLASGRPVLVLQNLGLASLPAWHFAVVIGFDAGREEVLLRSGTTERLVMSTRRFLRSWDLAGRWAIVVIEPGQLPASADSLRYLDAASGLEAAGRFDAAQRAYATAAATWPFAPTPWLGLGNVAHVRGEFEQAVGFYRRALSISPSDAAARNNLAQTLAEAGCIASAHAEAERALHDARGTVLEASVRATLTDIDARVPTGQCTLRVD
jgi:tetratricopeptide (TPR) repeat protein